MHPTPHPSTPLTAPNNKTWTASMLTPPKHNEPPSRIPARLHTPTQLNIGWVYNHRTALFCTFKVPNRPVVSRTSGSGKEGHATTRILRVPVSRSHPSSDVVTLVIGYEPPKTKGRRVCPTPIALPARFPLPIPSQISSWGNSSSITRRSSSCQSPSPKMTIPQEKEETKMQCQCKSRVITTADGSVSSRIVGSLVLCWPPPPHVMGMQAFNAVKMDLPRIGSALGNFFLFSKVSSPSSHPCSLRSGRGIMSHGHSRTTRVPHPALDDPQSCHSRTETFKRTDAFCSNLLRECELDSWAGLHPTFLLHEKFKSV
jgi:hypothetical protein